MTPKLGWSHTELQMNTHNPPQTKSVHEACQSLFKAVCKPQMLHQWRESTDRGQISVRCWHVNTQTSGQSGSTQDYSEKQCWFA